jgi:ribosomal-protein-alanine N-acetyltransferase
MVAAGEGYPFHIFRASDNRLIGACNIMQVRRTVAQSAQLGYWVGERYARQGFARAAVRASVQFCFDELGLHRIEAAVRPENVPSISLLEAVGFTYEGVAREYLKIDGAWRDHAIYARLVSDPYA